jgi:hypothetical protein
MKQIDSQTRLKSLLRELFQLDVADLDFGLYRLFHLKQGLWGQTLTFDNSPHKC